MRKGSILALAFISLNFCVHAAEATYFKFSNLLESESVKDVLDPAVRLYWAAQPAPEFQEVARRVRCGDRFSPISSKPSS